MILSSDILFHWHSVVNLLSAIKNLFHIIFYILHHSKMSKVYIFNYCIPLKKKTCFFSTHVTQTFLLFFLLTFFLCRIPLFSIFLFFHNFLDMRSFHYVVLYTPRKFFMSFSAHDIFISLFFLLPPPTHIGIIF